MSLKAFSGGAFGFADPGAELIKLLLGMPQLTIDHVQASDEPAQMDAGRFRNALRNFDGRFSQHAKHGVGIDATDAMLLEYLLDCRLA